MSAAPTPITMPARTIRIEMSKTKETKNTVRYDATSKDEFSNPQVDCIYVQRSTFKELGYFPETLYITVNF